MNAPAPFECLKANHYRVCYADPAWKFSAGPAKNPSQHYPTMKLKDIMALPVRELYHPDGARLFLWVTVPHLENGFKTLKAWGARYSSARFWLKLWPGEDGLFVYPDSFSRGTGYEVANDTEILLIGKFGRPEKAPSRKPRNSFMSQRREHSRKPAIIREQIAQMFAGPRCELFSRTKVEGFDHWGNHAGEFAD